MRPAPTEVFTLQDKIQNTTEDTPQAIIHWDEIETGTMTALWHPYILSGTVNLLQGDSTAGKSYLSQAIIAALTTGQALPNAEPMPPCNVIIQNAENSFSHVIKPRLQQLGADFTLVCYNKTVHPTKDIMLKLKSSEVCEK